LTVVITTCTNRKRKPIANGLHAASLAIGDLTEVANEWGGRLRDPSQRFPVMEVYGGRSFQDAKAVAELVSAEVFVVSAGLGLVDASEDIPSYACTVLEGADDGIGSKVLGEFSSLDWWSQLKRVSPFNRHLGQIIKSGDDQLVLAALSDSYIQMLSDDLLALEDIQISKLRLFTRAPLERIPQRLWPFVMPYDDRLDGPASPIKGTRSDFAGRALRHFSETILPSAEDRAAEEHASAVRHAMEGWPFPSLFERRRLSDDEIRLLLHEHWEASRGGTSALLRVFRDDLNIACEQGRFAALARQVRMERA
jgi:hypothetical protein